MVEITGLPIGRFDNPCFSGSVMLVELGWVETGPNNEAQVSCCI